MWIFEQTATILLFVIGGVSASTLTYLPGINTGLKRDAAYLLDIIAMYLIVSLLDTVLPLHYHLSAIASVCGVLAWAVYDDFFSEEHGMFHWRRKMESTHGAIPFDEDSNHIGSGHNGNPM